LFGRSPDGNRKFEKTKKGALSSSYLERHLQDRGDWLWELVTKGFRSENVGTKHTPRTQGWLTARCLTTDGQQ